MSVSFPLYFHSLHCSQTVWNIMTNWPIIYHYFNNLPQSYSTFYSVAEWNCCPLLISSLKAIYLMCYPSYNMIVLCFARYFLLLIRCSTGNAMGEVDTDQCRWLDWTSWWRHSGIPYTWRHYAVRTAALTDIDSSESECRMPGMWSYRPTRPLLLWNLYSFLYSSQFSISVLSISDCTFIAVSNNKLSISVKKLPTIKWYG